MKKAKVLVPALSMLCFSAIACVTGTVAWFTSVTNATVESSNFKIQSIEGSMEVALTPGVGTKLGTKVQTESSGMIVPNQTAGKDNALTHGSFNPATQQVWNVNKYDSSAYLPVAEGKTISADNDTEFLCDSTAGLYHIFSWDMTFSYNYKKQTVAPDINLYFDVSSVATVNGTIKADGTDAARGFRMAFVNVASDGTTADWLVWSPFQTATNMEFNPTGTNSSYVTSTTGTTEYAPGGTGNLFYKGDTSVVKITDTKGTSDRKDCLGTFSLTGAETIAQDKVSKINIRVVCWFEGLDANVENRAYLDNLVSSTIKFYVRDKA